MEITLLQTENVTVTNKLFVVGTETHAIPDITSAEFRESSPVRILPLLLIGTGAIPPAANYFIPGKWADFLASQHSPLAADRLTWLGLVVASLAIVWLVLQATKYTIILRTSGGEVRALTSTKRKFIVSILAALNQAIRAE